MYLLYRVLNQGCRSILGQKLAAPRYSIRPFIGDHDRNSSKVDEAEAEEASIRARRHERNVVGTLDVLTDMDAALVPSSTRSGVRGEISW